MLVNAVNDLVCGAADRFQRAFQFRKLLAAAPPGDIPERVVRRIKPVVLADGIGNAFRFHFAGTAVRSYLLLVFRCVQVNIMQLCV